MKLAYENEAAGLRIYEDDGPSVIHEVRAQVQSAQLPLPWAELSDTVMGLLEQAVLEVAMSAIRESHGEAFGDPIYVRERPDATERSIAVEVKHWPAVVAPYFIGAM